MIRLMIAKFRPAAIAVLLGSFMLAVPAQADSPFKNLAGRWVGGGSIKLADGSSEKISCKATYFVSNGGNGLSQNIRCASASYKFEVRSSLNLNGSAVSGSWKELTQNASGSVSGKASASTINLSVHGDKVSGSMSVALNGGSQSVTIRPSDSAVSSISIGMRKG